MKISENLKEKCSVNISELRKSRNVSQKSLAKSLGIGLSTIAMIESRKNLPSVEVLYSIADYFKVSLDYLVWRSDKP